jgi:hypothetical protein
MLARRDSRTTLCGVWLVGMLLRCVLASAGTTLLHWLELFLLLQKCLRPGHGCTLPVIFAPQSSLAPADKSVYESEEGKRSEAIRHIEWLVACWLVVCSCCAWSCRSSLGRMCVRFWLGMQRGCLCSWPGRPVQAGFVTLPWSLPLSVVRHTDRVHEPPKSFCCLIVSRWCIRG